MFELPQQIINHQTGRNSPSGFGNPGGLDTEWISSWVMIGDLTLANPVKLLLEKQMPVEIII